MRTPEMMLQTWAEEGVDSFAIRGDLRYAPGQSFGDPDADRLDLVLKATITGREVTADGFGPSVSLDILHKVGCDRPWCPVHLIDPEGRSEALFFLIGGAGAPVIYTGNCGTGRSGPDDQFERVLRQCLNGEPPCDTLRSD